MTKIYLIRHAEAEGNIYRRAHGHYNGGIIGRGYKQIELLADRFSNEKIDAVYSSDLERACVTAGPVCRLHNLPLNTTEKLREVNIGVWEDEAWGDLEYNEPEMSRYFTTDPARWAVRGSEGYMDVRKRMTDCICELARNHDGGTIAAFSHGFAIRAFLCAVSGFGSNEVSKVPYCDNTAVTLLTYDSGELVIKYQGDNSHLTRELSTFAHQTWWREGEDDISENLHYLPFDKERDKLLADYCLSKYSGAFSADNEYTAFHGNEAVGIVGLNTSKENNDNAGWLADLAVMPEFQKMDFGVQLIGQAVSALRKLKKEKLCVELPESEPTVNFFLKHDFAIRDQTGPRYILEKSIRNW